MWFHGSDARWGKWVLNRPLWPETGWCSPSLVSWVFCGITTSSQRGLWKCALQFVAFTYFSVLFTGSMGSSLFSLELMTQMWESRKFSSSKQISDPQGKKSLRLSPAVKWLNVILFQTTYSCPKTSTWIALKWMKQRGRLNISKGTYILPNTDETLFFCAICSFFGVP